MFCFIVNRLLKNLFLVVLLLNLWYYFYHIWLKTAFITSSLYANQLWNGILMCMCASWLCPFKGQLWTLNSTKGVYIFWNNTVLVGSHLQMYLSLSNGQSDLHCITNSESTGGGGFSGEKRRETHCLLRDVNHTFWHQLWCSEWNYTILSHHLRYL